MKRYILTSLAIVLGMFMQAQYIKLDASFYSASLDEMKMVDIFLPSNYYIDESIEYPVIYYLHGGGGNQNEGTQFANHYYVTRQEGSYADSVPPAIFVCPDGGYDPFYGSYWVNSALYGNYEDYVVNDLITFIDSEFRTKSDKNFRFITGYSMGGFGTAHIALSNPEKFRACAPQSAAYIAFVDSSMSTLEQRLLEENGDYHFQLGAGNASKFYFTVSGAYAPNLEIEPNHFESLWDTNGNWIDTVWNKWKQFDCSSKIKNLTPENNLSFFLTCGTLDDINCYPPYPKFEDSLEKYNIDYRSVYREYEHGTVDMEANKAIWYWMDSLAYNSYKHLGIDEGMIATDGKLDIYPNPASHTIHISLLSNNSETATISIYNQMGQKMGDETPFETTAVNNDLSLDISSFRNGVYFLKVDIDGKVVSKKFIKINQ